MNKGMVILIVCLAAIGLGIFGIYNKLVRTDEEVKNAWAQVDTVLQRRFDLIPNLVNTVKGYAQHETNVFLEVSRLRSQWAEAKSPGDRGAAADALNGAVARLMAVAENYPDLKANSNFMALQDELAGTENRIAVERKRYNEAVRNYNLAVRTYPGRFLAGTFGFTPKDDYLKADAGSHEAPKVQF